MIRLTKHALEAIAIRSIAFSWIEEVAGSPDFVEADGTRSACDPTKRSPNLAAGSYGLSIDQRATISSSLRCISIAELGDDQNLLRSGGRRDVRLVRTGRGKIRRHGRGVTSIMLDFDSEGRVIGIEVLDVSERMMRPKAAA
jgi:Protein of unknown function (DUF2283)